MLQRPIQIRFILVLKKHYSQTFISVWLLLQLVLGADHDLLGYSNQGLRLQLILLIRTTSTVLGMKLVAEEI